MHSALQQIRAEDPNPQTSDPPPTGSTTSTEGTPDSMQGYSEPTSDTTSTTQSDTGWDDDYIGVTSDPPVSGGGTGGG